MKRFRRSVLIVMAVALWQSLAMGAYAAPGSVLLGFGSDYVGPSGSTYVHRGVDMAAGAGEEFFSPVSGTVTFAGKVPGPHGGSVLAVSIDSVHGLVSILPLGKLDVAKGESISAGDSVGLVANEGDPSSSSSHVHVGLRNGSLYLDPMVLFVASAVPQTPEVEPVPAVSPDTMLSPSTPAPVLSPVAAPVSAPAVSPAPGAAVTSPGSAPAPEGAQVAPSAAAASVLGNGVSLASSAPSAAERAARTAADGEQAKASLASGEAVAAPAQTGVSIVPVDRSAAAVNGAHTQQPTTLWAELSSALSAGSAGLAQDLPRKAAIAVAVLAMAVASSVYILGRRAFGRRLSSGSPVSDRLGTILQQLRAGDTLRGLTSCSGYAAFTVPGPFSPEEVTK